MKALDTNVVVRLIVIDDNPAQTALARRAARSPCLLTTTVLLETAWVLQSVYALSRVEIAESLVRLLDVPTLTTPDEAAARWAIERYRDHGADMADMLHLLAAKGAATFVSFEKRLARQAGQDTPLPVELLQ